MLFGELDGAKEEMALESWVDHERTGSWIHGGNIHGALNFLDGKLCPVVPMLVIFVLTHESDGTLSIVRIESRHVKVINEVDELEFTDWSVDLTSSALKLLLENALEEHRVGIEVEVNDLLEIFVGLRSEIVQHTFNDLSLTTTSLTNKER